MPFSRSNVKIATPWSSFSRTKSQEFVQNARKRSRIIGKITGVSYGARHLHLFREIYVQNLNVQKIDFTEASDSSRSLIPSYIHRLLQ